MTADRLIAKVRSRDGYAGLMAAMRALVVRRNTTYEELDALAGLPSRYTSKLFCKVPIKGIGRHSLGPLMGALGFELWVVEDAVALAQIRGRIVQRVFKRPDTSDGIRPKRSRKKRALLGNRAWSHMMNCRRALLTNPEQRRASAKKAIRARWKKARATKPYAGKPTYGK